MIRCQDFPPFLISLFFYFACVLGGGHAHWIVKKTLVTFMEIMDSASCLNLGFLLLSLYPPIAFLYHLSRNFRNFMVLLSFGRTALNPVEWRKRIYLADPTS